MEHLTGDAKASRTVRGQRSRGHSVDLRTKKGHQKQQQGGRPGWVVGVVVFGFGHPASVEWQRRPEVVQKNFVIDRVCI